MLIQKLLNKETLIESVGFITIFTILQRIIQIGRGIIFARLLGPSEYGVYTLSFFFIPLIVTFAKLGIPSCYERYVPQYEKRGELGVFFKRNYLLTILAGIFFTIACLLLSKQISNLIYASIKYKNIIILCALTVIFYVLFENFIYSFNGLRIFKMGVLLQFSQFFLFTMLGIFLIIYYPKAESAILANLVSLIFLSTLFGWIIWKYILISKYQNSKIREDNFYSKIFKYSIWFIITPTVFTLFQYIDRWMLNQFLGLHEVGVYSVAVNITAVIFMFGIISGNVLLPNLSKIWEENQKDKAIFMLNFATKISTLILLSGAIIIVLFKNQIVSALYGAKYLEGVPVIGILLVYWLFNSIFWTIKGYSGLIEKTYLPFISITGGLFFNVGLNYILIPRYKIMGAAFATTIAFGINLIIIFLLNNREGMRIEFKTVIVCISTLILLLSGITLLFCIVLYLGIIFSTELIFTTEEKKLFLKFNLKDIMKFS